MTEGQLGREVLGGVSRPKHEGFIMDPELAKEPLRYEGTVTRCFCLDCGYSTELLSEAAGELGKKTDQPEPQNWKDHYLATHGCILCSGEYGAVTLHEIPTS